MTYANFIIALMLWLLPGTSFAQSSQDQHPIRFGILTPGWNTSWQDLRTVWQQAEQLGFDSAWVPDHVLAITGAETGPALDSWMLLAALAGETSRMRIGCLVTANTFRYPAVLAKMATTVDHLSNGAWHSALALPGMNESTKPMASHFIRQKSAPSVWAKPQH